MQIQATHVKPKFKTQHTEETVDMVGRLSYRIDGRFDAFVSQFFQCFAAPSSRVQSEKSKQVIF